VAINHYTTHISNKTATIVLPQSNLQKGMIVQCRYRNKDRSTKNYMLLVLNKYFNGYIHLLSLNEMSPTQLNNLARITGLTNIPKYNYNGIDFEKLLILESSNRFYVGKLKGKMKTTWGSSYRTFKANQLSALMLVDYGWDGDIPVPPKGVTVNQMKKVNPAGKIQIPKDYDGRKFDDVQ
jgi:hypothetical protein